MASLLGSRNFINQTTSGASGSGHTAAGRLADVYLKTHTNEAGEVDDPAVIDHAIEILAPYADNLVTAKKIADLQNKKKALGTKAFEQDNALSDFKRNVSEALYVRGDTLRSPSEMAYSTAQALDNVLIGLDNAIDFLEQRNKSTDKLEDYRRELSAMADAQRQLVNGMATGTLPPSLDGYGYFVKTNPIDGSLVGAVLLPINQMPAEFKDGTKRINHTVTVGNSQLPVYLPAVKNADGEWEAKLYENTWSGTGDILDSVNTPDFEDDTGFDLADTVKFPIKKTTLANGSFGRVLQGVQDGQSVYSYYYKGFDGKMRQLDETSLQQLRDDPYAKTKLESYIPLLSREELKGAEVTPFQPKDVRGIQLYDDQMRYKQEADAATEAMNRGGKVGEFADKVAPTIRGFFSKLNPFNDQGRNPNQSIAEQMSNRTNRPSPPNTPNSNQSEGVKVDIINKGKEFFRNLA